MKSEGEVGEKVLFPELSYAILGAAMDVHNALGPGWDEEACHIALLHALHAKGLNAESKRRGELMHRDTCIHRFVLDIVVEDSIILELKNMVAPFAPVHFLQLINYLKFWNKPLGILINFGLDRLTSQRIPYTPEKGAIIHDENWDAFRDSAPEEADLVDSLSQVILDQHGLGYHTAIYKELFKAECAFRKINYEAPDVNLSFGDLSLGTRKMDAFCINSRVFVIVSAMGGTSSSIDRLRMKHYLRTSHCSIGLIAHFGQQSLNLHPILL